MKIIYLIHSLHTAGGMEKILSSKANWLCKQEGYKVFIVTSHLHSRKPFFPLEPEVQLFDIGVNENIFGRKYRNRLQAIINDICPDITVSLCGNDVYQLWKCSGTGVKLAEYHFSHDKFFRKYRFLPLLAGLRTRRLDSTLGKYDALVVLSRFDLDYYRKVLPYPDRCFKISNTMNLPVSGMSALDCKRFVCVGRLVPQKNFSEALKIWRIVSEKHPEWRLDIFGEGKERKMLEGIISRQGLSQYVSLKGNSASIMDELHRSSGILVTSRHEGFGLVVLEAASCGVPVVTYFCPGGLAELVSDGKDGFIVPKGDAEAAAQRIIEIIENQGLRKEMGAAAFEKASAFAPEVIMPQWLELFYFLTNTGIVSSVAGTSQ